MWSTGMYRDKDGEEDLMESCIEFEELEVLIWSHGQLCQVVCLSLSNGLGPTASSIALRRHARSRGR